MNLQQLLLVFPCVLTLYVLSHLVLGIVIKAK